MATNPSQVCHYCIPLRWSGSLKVSSKVCSLGCSLVPRLRLGSLLGNDLVRVPSPLFVSPSFARASSVMRMGNPSVCIPAAPSSMDTKLSPLGFSGDEEQCDRPGLKVIIVGAGVGGLALGGRLAKQGFNVHILEKNDGIGGRMQSLVVHEKDMSFRFDTGPSLLLLPQQYTDAFAAIGETLDDYVTLKRVEPAAYRVFFGEKEGPASLDLLYDVQAMCTQLEKVEVGASAAFLCFLSRAKEALDKGTENFIVRDFRTFWDYANVPRLLPLLKQLSPFELLGQHHGRMQKYFRSPKLQALFTFQDLYVGLSPYNAPGVFSLLAATELINGVWYPVGGFGKVGEALAQVAQKAGAEIHTNVIVASIDHKDGKASGVTLEDGTFMGADIVVANADLPYAYNNLIHGTGTSSNRWSKKLLQYNYSAGVIAYNWALDKRLKVLRHHNVFLSDVYQESWNRATDPSSLVEQPNFYVHVPAHTDQSAAPADGDAITVLLPVANMGEGYNGDLASCDKQMVDAGRVAILKRLKNSGVGDLAPHILREVIYSPPTWQKMYNLQYGAAFGLSHDLLQLAYFRPDVAHPLIRGLYFVGASTRPGNGVPLVLMGAKITGNRIIEDHHHSALSSSSI